MRRKQKLRRSPCGDLIRREQGTPVDLHAEVGMAQRSFMRREEVARHGDKRRTEERNGLRRSQNSHGDTTTPPTADDNDRCYS